MIRRLEDHGFVSLGDDYYHIAPVDADFGTPVKVVCGLRGSWVTKDLSLPDGQRICPECASRMGFPFYTVTLTLSGEEPVPMALDTSGEVAALHRLGGDDRTTFDFPTTPGPVL